MIDISTCAEPLSNSPHGLALFHAWNRWRGGEQVPSTKNVMAEDLGPALGHISVLEIPCRQQAIPRLVSGAHDRAAGRYLKGENIIDLTAEEDKAIRIERLWNMAIIPCGMLWYMNLVHLSRPKSPIGGFTLPVVPSSPDEPARLFVAIDCDWNGKIQIDKPIQSIPLAPAVTYVDIGFGAPE